MDLSFILILLVIAIILKVFKFITKTVFLIGIIIIIACLFISNFITAF